jgi:hypothetical protein
MPPWLSGYGVALVLTCEDHSFKSGSGHFVFDGLISFAFLPLFVIVRKHDMYEFYPPRGKNIFVSQTHGFLSLGILP